MWIYPFLLSNFYHQQVYRFLKHRFENVSISPISDNRYVKFKKKWNWRWISFYKWIIFTIGNSDSKYLLTNSTLNTWSFWRNSTYPIRLINLAPFVRINERYIHPIFTVLQVWMLKILEIEARETFCPVGT